MLGNTTSYHIIFTPQKDGVSAKVVNPGVYPKMLLAHKGKGGTLFNALGYGAAACLLILYISGIVMFWKVKSRRKPMLISAALGIIAVIIGYLMI